MSRRRRADVVVIGCGIVGAACAYRLAEAGLDTIVLEQHAAPATGSTGRSVAGVRIQFVERCNVLLSLRSIEEFRRFEHEHGQPSGYRPIGYLLLVPSDRWDAHLEGVAVQRAVGAPVEGGG